MNIFNREEKKVEYIELIYDLIFVYMVGRNNSLLHNFDGGFIAVESMIAYTMCTLAIIQIWSFTTFYINLFGRNGIRDHVFFFINMYLMYFVGDSTRQDWNGYQDQYHIAWGLILVNIGVQYLIELRNHKADVWNRDMIKKMAHTLFVEAAIVLGSAFMPVVWAVVASFAAILTGILMTVLGRTRSGGQAIDFNHITERAMLYVVFTFGEMIIVLADYFVSGGEFNPNVIYFSLMAFIVVAGLFVSYELFYDHLLDRDKEDNGLLYMLIHIFIIFALNNITSALEFMREGEVAVFPKIMFMVVSIVAYYIFLFCNRRYAKIQSDFNIMFVLKLAALTVAFIILMIVFRNIMAVNLFVTAAYVFTINIILYLAKKKHEKELSE
ncbi:MAG: low temperature requirement protein A [Lachnospiraceae bacterium]|nr:low temperature requirement protein A [Lachnospiraceae bacterium]